MAGSNALIQFQPSSYASQYTENANSNEEQNQLLSDNSIPYPNTVINPLKSNHRHDILGFDIPGFKIHTLAIIGYSL
ncbi:9058_t:CDS:2 [Funneliformis caledonium]|uniref:9058_t:CDS:1 n=1 Tax=Funneliformis caledonium TaxID=1117310 RepID=A0A9N9BXA2_9GLOM|nr:9058_t:CDS:2 [Funneliformis caledonium]